MADCTKIPFKRGDYFFSERPFAYALNESYAGVRCDYCFKKENLHKCVACKVTAYCNQQCQKKGWPVHKNECPKLAMIGPNPVKKVPGRARLLARLIWKLKRGGAEIKSFYAPGKFRSFGDLMTHSQEIRADPEFMLEFKYCMAYLPSLVERKYLPDPAIVFEIFCKMVINSFYIIDNTVTIGSGLYLAASMLDHSCKPNAEHHFDGPELKLRALDDMPVLDWSKVHIPYIDTLQLPSERQKSLLRGFFFHCECEGCVDVEELGLMTSSICTNCSATIPFGTHEPNKKCSKCLKNVSLTTWERITAVKEFTLKQIHVVKEVIKELQSTGYSQAMEDENVAKNLDMYLICLKKQEGLFHSMNMLRVQALQGAVKTAVRLNKFKTTIELGHQLIPSMLKYCPRSEGTRILLMEISFAACFEGDYQLQNNCYRMVEDMCPVQEDDIRVTDHDLQSLRAELSAKKLLFK